MFPRQTFTPRLPRGDSLSAAFLAAIALAAPAAADNHIDGGGNDTTVKPWDTDNLRYRGYSARNFRIPFHEYAGYAAFTDNTTFQSRAREACQSAIADGFFQTGGSVGAKTISLCSLKQAAAGAIPKLVPAVQVAAIS